MLRLRGDIGEFDSEHLGTPGRDILLSENPTITVEEINKLIKELGGNPHANVHTTFSQQISKEKLYKLRELADKEYKRACEEGGESEDLKISMSKNQLVDLIG